MAMEDALTWTPGARTRLQQVPDGVMRELTKQRVERLAQQLGRSTVSVELMETKYEQWSQGAAPSTTAMAWTEQAQAAIDRAPDFVRPMVIKAIEAYAANEGATEITPEIMDAAKRFWDESGRFHQP